MPWFAGFLCECTGKNMGEQAQRTWRKLERKTWSLQEKGVGVQRGLLLTYLFTWDSFSFSLPPSFPISCPFFICTGPRVWGRSSSGDGAFESLHWFSNNLSVSHSWHMVILDANLELEGFFPPNVIFHVAWCVWEYFEPLFVEIQKLKVYLIAKGHLGIAAWELCVLPFGEKEEKQTKKAQTNQTKKSWISKHNKTPPSHSKVV